MFCCLSSELRETVAGEGQCSPSANHDLPTHRGTVIDLARPWSRVVCAQTTSCQDLKTCLSWSDRGCQPEKQSTGKQQFHFFARTSPHQPVPIYPSRRSHKET